MRDLAFMTVFVALLPMAFLRPHVGMLVWCWISVMTPHQLTWGWPSTLPLNQVVALATIAGWMLSPKEPKRIPLGTTTLLIIAFTAWFTLSSVYSLSPENTWRLWDRYFKIMITGLLIMALVRDRPRLHALVWILALSLGYYGVKGGLFVIATGGNYRVHGPAGTVLGDNNQMALALCMAIPLFNYLRLHSAARPLRLGLAAATALTVLAVLGTYSRGGFLALCALSLYFWWRSTRRVQTAVAALAVLVPAVLFMPEQWTARMETTSDYEQDQSAQSRFESWAFSWRVALDRPLVGGGVNAIYDESLWREYYPGVVPHVAHSIYFQVLGDDGFVGLGLYLALAASAWLNTVAVARRARGRPELRWAYDLALMTRLSLFAFLTAGALLAVAYYDVYVTLVAISAALRRLVEGATMTVPHPRASRMRGYATQQTTPAGLGPVAR